MTTFRKQEIHAIPANQNSGLVSESLNSKNLLIRFFSSIL